MNDGAFWFYIRTFLPLTLSWLFFAYALSFLFIFLYFFCRIAHCTKFMSTRALTFEQNLHTNSTKRRFCWARQVVWRICFSLKTLLNVPSCTFSIFPRFLIDWLRLTLTYFIDFIEFRNYFLPFYPTRASIFEQTLHTNSTKHRRLTSISLHFAELGKLYDAFVFPSRLVYVFPTLLLYLAFEPFSWICIQTQSSVRHWRHLTWFCWARQVVWRICFSLKTLLNVQSCTFSISHGFLHYVLLQVTFRFLLSLTYTLLLLDAIQAINLGIVIWAWPK